MRVASGGHRLVGSVAAVAFSAVSIGCVTSSAFQAHALQVENRIGAVERQQDYLESRLADCVATLGSVIGNLEAVVAAHGALAEQVQDELDAVEEALADIRATLLARSRHGGR